VVCYYCSLLVDIFQYWNTVIYSFESFEIMFNFNDIIESTLENYQRVCYGV